MIPPPAAVTDTMATLRQGSANLPEEQSEKRGANHLGPVFPPERQVVQAFRQEDEKSVGQGEEGERQSIVPVEAKDAVEAEDAVQGAKLCRK